MSDRRRGGRVTVLEMAAAPSGWRAGLHQIAREVTVWTDPLLTLFFDKQRLREELQQARDLDLVRDRVALEPPVDTLSPDRRVEDTWPGDHWPIAPPTNVRDNPAERAELPPQLDGWENEAPRHFEDEWPSR